MCAVMWYSLMPTLVQIAFDHSQALTTYKDAERVTWVRLCNHVKFEEFTANTKNSNTHCARCVEIRHLVNVANRVLARSFPKGTVPFGAPNVPFGGTPKPIMCPMIPPQTNILSLTWTYKSVWALNIELSGHWTELKCFVDTCNKCLILTTTTVLSWTSARRRLQLKLQNWGLAVARRRCLIGSTILCKCPPQMQS